MYEVLTMSKNQNIITIKHRNIGGVRSAYRSLKVILKFSPEDFTWLILTKLVSTGV